MSQTPRSHLPIEIEKQRSILDMALGLSLAAVLFVGAEVGLRRYLTSHPSSVSAWLFDGKWNLLMSMDKGADWIILGDSSASFGIDRELFLAGTGESAANLATVAEALTVNDAWMLETYIDKFGPPKHVLLIRSARQWGLPVNEILATSVPLDYGYWERLDPALPFDTHAKWLYLVNRYAPFYKAPRTIRQLLEPPWQGLPDAAQIQPGGFLKFDGRPSSQLFDSVKQLAGQLESSGFSVSTPSLSGLAALARLAEKHGFHIYIAMAPVCRLVYLHPRFRQEHQRLAAQLTRLVAHSPYLHLLSRDPMLFTVTEMQNADHLLAPAATRYTAALVERLEYEIEIWE
ncbi:MAG: hypothetical protein MUC50_20205 [Myxococcota bacterium]|jgi:hypothetical protein|nr:hypothetical protein [Myxococcota bacterium]